MSRRRTIALAAVLLGGGALALFCCSARDQHAESAPPTTPDSDPGAQPAAPNTAPATASAPGPTPTVETARTAVVAGTSDAAAASATPVLRPVTSGTARPAGAVIADAVAKNDPRDLELLSRIERELGRDVPPGVHTILRRRREGAGRAELLALVRALPELSVRVQVLRWLDQVLVE